MTKTEFEIEYISEVEEGYVLARTLNQGHDFTLTDNSRLGGLEIRKFTTQPRALDKHGNPRFDLYVFHLKEKSDVKKLRSGQIIELAD